MCGPTGRPPAQSPSRSLEEPRFQSVGQCHTWNVLFREGQIRIPRESFAGATPPRGIVPDLARDVQNGRSHRVEPCCDGRGREMPTHPPIDPIKFMMNNMGFREP